MDNKQLCRITASGDTHYLLSTYLLNEGFELLLHDGSTLWCGFVSAEELSEYSNKIGMDYNELLDQTRKALTCRPTDNLGFLYEMKSVNDHTKQFTWKSYKEAKDIKLRLGSVILHQSSTPSADLFQMFEHSLKSLNDLKEKVDVLQNENTQLRRERETDIKRLDKVADAKEEFIKNLYSKFVPVLNEKKAKVKRLHDELNRLQHAASEPMTEYAKRAAARKSSETQANYEGDTDDDNRRKVQEQECESDYNTEEEAQHTTERTARSVSENKSFADNTTEMLIDEDAVNLPVVKRGRRKTPRSKQQSEVTKISAGSRNSKPKSRQRAMVHSVSPERSDTMPLDETCDLIDGL